MTPIDFLQNSISFDGVVSSFLYDKLKNLEEDLKNDENGLISKLPTTLLKNT